MLFFKVFLPDVSFVIYWQNLEIWLNAENIIWHSLQTETKDGNDSNTCEYLTLREIVCFDILNFKTITNLSKLGFFNAIYQSENIEKYNWEIVIPLKYLNWQSFTRKL